MAVAIALVAIFDEIPVLFVSVCIAGFAYVVIEALGGKLS